MNEEQRNGESGEKPELSRNCKGSRPAVVLSQRGRQTMNRARVPFDFIIKRLARHEPDGRWEKFFSFQFGCAFYDECNFYGRQSAGKKGRGNTMGIFDSAIGYFVRGGLCMWPLLFCSLAVIFLAVERYVYYRQAISDTKFVMMFCKEMTRGKVSEAAGLAEKESGSAAKLAKDILSEKDSLGQSLESVTYEKTDRYLNQLSAHLDYLGVIIGLSPMLGLLGTITGMMGTFSSMTGQLQNTAGVTAGLAEALITTIFGLVIAIAGMLAHAYLNARYKKAMLDLDAVADALISGLSGK